MNVTDSRLNLHMAAVEAPAHRTTVDPNAQVFNLTVLVQQTSDGTTKARAANLNMAEVQSASMRSALSQIVSAAKKLIAEHIASDRTVPWIEPPQEAIGTESRFMVPLHL